MAKLQTRLITPKEGLLGCVGKGEEDKTLKLGSGNFRQMPPSSEPQTP